MCCVCRYHKRMKRAYFWIPCCLFTGVLLCIWSVHSAFAADGSVISGVEVKKEPAVVIETVPSTDTQQTVRLYPFDQIPDSAEVRQQILTRWLSAPINDVIKLGAEVYTDSKGNTFTVSGAYAENDKAVYTISVIPLLTDYSMPDRHLVPQGAWILQRSVDTGAPLSIKIYPRENAALLISLRPAAQKAYRGKSFIDIHLFNAYVCRDIAVGVPFEALYQLSLAGLKTLTNAVVPWDIFNPPRYNSPVRVLSQIVQSRLDRLVYIPDACFDHEGTPVHISTQQPQTELELNTALRIDQIRSEISGGVDSAGFAKWVIDGMVRPVAGQGIMIEALKRSTDIPKTHFTKPMLSTANVFLWLDWVRNLGAAALSLNLNRTVYPSGSGLDVTVCPFALDSAAVSKAEKTSDKVSQFLGYQQYAGYQTSYLLPLLYYLTITEADHFYLACLSTGSTGSDLRTYDKIAVFFPYFDEWGTFHLDIYENGAFVSSEDFIKNNADRYTALVRVRAPEVGLFNP